MEIVIIDLLGVKNQPTKLFMVLKIIINRNVNIMKERES
jgi:hypothetical protein